MLDREIIFRFCKTVKSDTDAMQLFGKHTPSPLPGEYYTYPTRIIFIDFSVFHLYCLPGSLRSNLQCRQ